MGGGVPGPNVDTALRIELQQPITFKCFLNFASKQGDGVGFGRIFDFLNILQCLASRRLHVWQFPFGGGRQRQKWHGFGRSEQAQYVDHFDFQRRVLRLQCGEQRPQRFRPKRHEKLLDWCVQRSAVRIGQHSKQGWNGIVVGGEDFCAASRCTLREGSRNRSISAISRRGSRKRFAAAASAASTNCRPEGCNAELAATFISRSLSTFAAASASAFSSGLAPAS